MGEYIEREALITRLQKVCATDDIFGKGIQLGIEHAVSCTKQAPSADVTEVKHGEWHLLKSCANEGVYCSACNKKVYKTYYANQKIKSPYCPNCGAKMDKKEGAEK